MDGKLKSLLSAHGTTIVERWFESILDTYPEETARFLRREPDRFANPLGQTVKRAIQTLWDEIAADAPDERLRAPLDDIIRIRAIQDLRPAVALAFVFRLKPIVRDVLGDAQAQLAREVRALEGRVDEIALLAFEIYAACREQLAEIRVTEMKQRTLKLIERMNRPSGDPGQES